MKRPETTRAAETRLIANLREQHDLHERMLGELKSKREAIRTADMQRVFEVSEREQRIVMRMTTLEQNRLEAIQQIIPANVRQNGAQPTLSDVLPHVSPSARQEIEMPITEAVCAVLSGASTPGEAVRRLLTRDPRAE